MILNKRDMDRFTGEFTEPPIAFKDSFGVPVRVGEKYYDADGTILSEKKAREMAWLEFKNTAKEKIAGE